MTKKLQEIFDLPDIDDALSDDITAGEALEQSKKLVAQAQEEQKVLMGELSNSEKINQALTAVEGFAEHDTDMDDIATKALDTFKELHDLGLQVTDAHAGKIFEVASTMLKTALEAKDAKASRKLKQVELMIKKQKLDQDRGEGGSGEGGGGTEFDRNELLSLIKNSQKEQSSDK
jgi:hypothetical protein